MKVNFNTTSFKDKIGSMGNNAVKCVKSAADNLPSCIKDNKKEIAGGAVAVLSILSAITVTKAMINYSSKLKAKAKQ